MSADCIAKIVLFVGSAGGIASLYPQLLPGIPGARKHRGDVVSVSSWYEAAQFLAWVRYSQPELSFKVCAVVTDTALEMDTKADLLKSFSNNDSHIASWLEGGKRSITTSMQDFLYACSKHDDRQRKFLWEENLFSLWEGGDPRVSVASAIEWLEYNVQAIRGSLSVTMSHEMSRIMSSAHYYINIDEVKIFIEQFYAKK